MKWGSTVSDVLQQRDQGFDCPAQLISARTPQSIRDFVVWGDGPRSLLHHYIKQAVSAKKLCYGALTLPVGYL